MKKKKALYLLLLSVFASTYISGIIVQFIDPSVRNGGTKSIVQDSVTFNPFKSILYSFSNQTGMMISFAEIILIVLICFLKYLNNEKKAKYDERNFKVSEKGTYGTAAWLDEKEAKQLLDYGPIESIDGTILGMKDDMVIASKVDSRLNKHLAIFGASGVGKSRCYGRNAIIQCAKRGESIIMTDPKGELYADTATYLWEKGYNVQVFNLVEPKFSNSWACLNEITADEGQEDLNAQIFSNIIIENTGGKTGKDFWDNAEMNLLKALCLLVALDEHRRPEEKSIGAVYDYLTNKTEPDIEAEFNALPAAHPALKPWNLYKKAGNISGNIIIGLGNRMSVFQNATIQRITQFNEIDLEGPAREKTALFVIISDQNSTFEFLSSLLFSFLFIKLVKYADTKSQNGTCDVPVNFILDEFPNIGQIPDFTKKLSTVRSRDIRVAVIFQNVAQLANRYPDGLWEEIIGNCDTQLFLGCSDQTTAEYISKRSGEITVDVDTDRVNRYAMALTQDVNQYSQSTSTGKRFLLTPDEVMRLPNENCLIILRGRNILKALKYDYSNHPEAKKLKYKSIREFIPPWKAQTETKSTADEESVRNMAKKNKAKQNHPSESKSSAESRTYNDINKKTDNASSTTDIMGNLDFNL